MPSKEDFDKFCSSVEVCPFCSISDPYLYLDFGVDDDDFCSEHSKFYDRNFSGFEEIILD